MDEESQSPSHVPVGVWIFWIVIVLVALGWVFSRDTDGSKPVLLITQLIATVATAVSALAAMWAARLSYRSLMQTQADRKEEVLSRRPYFTFIEGRLGEQVGDEPSSFVESLFINVGVHPAGDITGHAVFITDLPYGYDVQVITYNPVGDVPSHQQFKFSMAGFDLPDTQDNWHYVVFILHYIDAVTKGQFEQIFYLQGPRYTLQMGLHVISRVVKPRLDSQINWEELRRKSGHHPSSR